MGADLYIHSLSEKCRQVWEPYFNTACETRNGNESTENFERDTKVLLSETKDKDLEALYHEAGAADFQRYVELAYDKMHEQGYFRDSYNNSNLLWRLGLDYWGYVGSLLDDERNMQPEQVRAFREAVAAAHLAPIASDAECDQLHLSGTAAEWNQYFAEKKERLLAFLDQAITLNEPIDCSI